MIAQFFWFSNNWGLFTQKISCGKNIVHSPGRITKVGQSTFFQRCYRKNYNSEQYKNIEHIIFVSNKFKIICKEFLAKITWLRMCIFPLQHPRKSRDFVSFSDVLEKKLETSLRTIFYILCNILRTIFQYIPGGPQMNFH